MVFGTSVPGFKSFQDLAKSVSPNSERGKEPDVVSNLVESLFEPERDQTESFAVNEAMDNLLKRMDGSSDESFQENKPTPKELTGVYEVFKDSDEVFECKISIEGASLSNSRARLVLTSDAWNFVFNGKLYGDGKCKIPIPKGIPLAEGTTGKIELEIIADDHLFIGWESDFVVRLSKKVKVEFKDKKAVKVRFE